MANSGRGGERVPGEGKKLGAPRKDAKELTVRKSYRLPPDVVAILDRAKNATRLICEAVRAYDEVRLSQRGEHERGGKEKKKQR